MLQQDNILDSRPLGSAAGMPDLAPALSETFNAIGMDTQFTRLQWVPDVDCFLFGDGKTIHAFSDNCLPLWTIPAQYKLNGWTVSGSSLFIQDGCILTQYNMDALIQNAKAAPDCAINLKTHINWSAQKDPASEYQALFTGCTGDDLLYSSPVISGSDTDSPTFFILTGGGMIIPLPANMQASNPKVFNSNYKPDTLDLFLFKTANANVLRYSSGGQAISVNADTMDLISAQTPASDVEWVRLCRAATTQSQPCVSLDQSGLQYAALATRSDDPDSSPKLLFSIYDYSASECDVFIMDARTTGLVAAGGRLVAQGGAASGLPWLLSAPAIKAEGDAIFLFAVTSPQRTLSANGTAQFQKYKISGLSANPSAQDAFALFDSQFKAAQQWTAAGGTGTAVPFNDSITSVCLLTAGALCGTSVGALNIQPQNVVKTVGDLLASMAATGIDAGTAATTLCRILKNINVSANDMAAGMKSVGYDAATAVAVLTANYCPLPQIKYNLFEEGDANEAADDLAQDSNKSASVIALGAAMQAAGYLANDAVAGMIQNKMDPMLTLLAILKGYPGNGKQQNEDSVKDAYENLMMRNGGGDNINMMEKWWEAFLEMIIAVETAFDIK